MKTIIAQREFIAVDSNDRKFSIVIKIGKPYLYGDNQGWACPVALEGLHKKLGDIRGVDSYQSLALAVKFVKMLLEHFIEKGCRLFFLEDDDSPINIDDLDS